MSGERWGVRFSEEGTDVNKDENLVYDSDLDQVKVSTVANPPHLYYFKPLKTMTNLTASSTNPVVSEDLLKFKHNLPYIPSVWVYFNIIDTPPSIAFYIGRYLINFVRLGGTLVYAHADETYVYIKHDFYYSVPPPPNPPIDPLTETDAEKFNLRVKVLVMNGRYAGQIYKAAP